VKKRDFKTYPLWIRKQEFRNRYITKEAIITTAEFACLGKREIALVGKKGRN